MHRKAFAAFAASLSFYVTGEVRGWASPAVPSLQGLDGLNNSLSYAPLSKEAASWIGRYQLGVERALKSPRLGPARQYFDVAR